MVLLRCELHALRASADGPIPPHLLGKGTKKATDTRIAELEALLAAKKQSRNSNEWQPLQSSRFLALVIAVAHHQV